MLTRIYEDNPSEKALRQVVKELENDNCIVYPTDSVYALGCSARSAKALEKLRKMKDKEFFSLVFADISQIAEYCRVDNATFKILKRNLPGAVTFVLPASSRVPHKAVGKRKTIGVRIPDNAIARAIVEMLGEPLISTSLVDESLEREYNTDPSLIEERVGRDVAMVVDGGMGGIEPSTVVEIVDGEAEILREGKHELL